MRAFLSMRRDFGRDTWSISSELDYFYNTPNCENIEVSVVLINKLMKYFMKNEADDSFVDFINSGAMRVAKIDLVYSQNNKGQNIVHGVKGSNPSDVNHEQWSDFLDEIRVFFSDIAIDECGESYEENNLRNHGAIRGTVSIDFAVKAIKSVQWYVFYDKRDRESRPIKIESSDVEEFFGSVASMGIEQLSM